jgi:CRISPR-associated endonuclease/helicase Cas3
MMFLRKTPSVAPVTDVFALELSQCYAKTNQADNGETVFGFDVETHCKIVGMVAEELGSRFPEDIRNKLFPKGVGLIAASHDVGKINPLFQEKLRRFLTHYPPDCLEALASSRPELEETTGYHSGVGQAALEGVGKYIPQIVGRHHGASPKTVCLAEDSVIGGMPWQEVRIALIDKLKVYFQESWPFLQDDLHAAVISGLTTVADWIGSSLVQQSKEEGFDFSNYKQLVAQAVNQAGFIFPKIIANLSFQKIFSFEPRPMQQTFIDMVDRPGVYILEASMGQGKTEAALFAAYKMLEKGLATGIYFALPTKLTSEKIYERMYSFLNSILASDDMHNLLLLHGTSWLIDTELGEEGRPGYSWFDTNKRGILAPFAVGTIDQALMAVMNVRHGFVRTFGLTGKVVILDEVHTYDAYTGTIMDNLIEALRKLDCTVILLSATLTTSRKQKMLGALVPEEKIGYPQILKSVTKGEISLSGKLPTEQKNVEVTMAQEGKDIFALVRRKALAGEQILWIENTVPEAQKAYKEFASWGSQVGVEVGLLHSRFPVHVRNGLDSKWVSLFGKEGKTTRRICGRILFGTQVLEQSLDIDADFLVTRIAPTDMLLQRIGRLYRHRELDELRPESAHQTVCILTPLLDNVLKDPVWGFGSSGVVYAPYVLARSLEIWMTEKIITIPLDMRRLIERTYEERNEEEPLSSVKYALIKKREALEKFAFNSLTQGGETGSDNCSTRYADLPTCDVLLLRREPDLRNGSIVLLDGTILELPQTRAAVTLKRKKEISKALMEQIIRVPEYLAPNFLQRTELNWLSPYLYVSTEDSERIRLAICEKSGSIRALGERVVNEFYEISYSPLLGYSAKKKGKEVAW